MTVGARLREKMDRRYLRRFPGRGQEEGEEEEEVACILQHQQLEEEREETRGYEEQQQSPRPQGEVRGNQEPHSKRVHFAFLPKRYEPLEEQAAGEKPKKKYRKKLKKYGKNVGKVITKGCRYFVIGLQGLATAYSAPFSASATLVNLVR
ncbi:required for drug-induced death protein 1 [Monodelphis domestica]|uniref:Chromosome 1 open reading frame 115 n=1 Tax=Monodelphis domestica TaxID=13616 RepID=A0A5F8GDR4_MONDO|nr:required for drug-induced death protein 1 [Monodelphis domestica]